MVIKDLADSIGVGLAAVDNAGRQTYVNPAFCEMVGWPAEELLDAFPPYVYWPPEEHSQIEHAFTTTIAGNAPDYGFELRFQRRDGARFDVLVSVNPLADGSGWIASVTRVTSRTRALRAQSFLAEAGRVLASSLDYQATLRSVAKLAVPAIADYCLIDLLHENGEIQRVEIAHRDAKRVDTLWQMYKRWPARLTDAWGIGSVLRTRSPILASVISDEMFTRFTSDPERLQYLRSMELRSSIIVPMIARDRVLGAITLNSASSERIFGESDLELAKALAERSALAIDNARLFTELQAEMRTRADLEADFGLAVKAGGFGYWTWDVASNAVTWDSRYRDIFGLPHDAAPDFEMGINAVHPEDLAFVRTAIGKAAQLLQDYEAEFRVIVNDDVRWIMARGRAFGGADGKMSRMAGFVLDITERVRSEERWKADTERLALALGHSGLGDWSWDAATDLVTFSERAAEIFDIPVEPSITWTEMRSLLHRNDAPIAAEGVSRALATKSEYSVEYRVRRREGGYRWIEARGRGIYDVDGNPAGMIGTVRDVTERHKEQETASILAQAGAALSSLEPQEILQRLVRLAAGTVGDYAIAYLVNADGTFAPVATAHVRPDCEALVAEIARIAKPEPGSNHFVSRAVMTGQPVSFARIPPGFLESTSINPRHLEILRTLRPTGAIAVPLIARGRPVAVYAVVRVELGAELFEESDFQIITQLASRAALAVDNGLLYQEVQSANAAKGQFLATMSHELRTPLNAIVGYSDLMDAGVAGELNPRQREYLNNIRTSANHQLSLINEILDFTQMEAVRQEVHVEPLDLRALLQEVVDMLAPLAAKKRITLGLAPAPALELHTDRAKLKQIILNIVVNAVKFTDKGRIAVDAVIQDELTIVRISDTGPGIPNDKLDAIFEPFFQIDQSRTRKNGGTGLGLAIARRLAGAIGAEICVYSEVGKGATFEIRMPNSSNLLSTLVSA